MSQKPENNEKRPAAAVVFLLILKNCRKTLVDVIVNYVTTHKTTKIGPSV